jgi:hypothetical protein
MSINVRYPNDHAPWPRTSSQIGRAPRLPEFFNPIEHSRDIRWKYETRTKFERVWIDVSKLDQMLQLRPQFYVGHGGQNGIRERYARIGEFVALSKALDMPQVYIDRNRGFVDIYDGRHRFAWMRDHGAQALPVSAQADELTEIKRLVGTKSRTCRVTCGPLLGTIGAGSTVGEDAATAAEREEDARLRAEIDRPVGPLPGKDITVANASADDDTEAEEYELDLDAAYEAFFAEVYEPDFDAAYEACLAERRAGLDGGGARLQPG